MVAASTTIPQQDGAGSESTTGKKSVLQLVAKSITHILALEFYRSQSKARNSIKKDSKI